MMNRQLKLTRTSKKSDGLEVICQFIVIIEPYEAGISFKPDTESKDEAVIQCGAISCILISIVEIQNGGQYVCEYEIDKQDHTELIHGLFDGLQDDEKGLTSSKKL